MCFLQISSFRKGIAYHVSCLDTETINDRGTKPLEDLIKEYGSWTITSNNWDGKSWSMVNYLAKMRRKLALGPFFTVFIGADQRNSNQNTIQVSDYHKTKRELNPFRCKRLPRKLVYMVIGVEKKRFYSDLDNNFFSSLVIPRGVIFTFTFVNAKRELNHFRSFNLVVNYSTLFFSERASGRNPRNPAI